MREVYMRVIAVITIMSITMGIMVSGALLPVLAAVGVIANGSFNGYNGIPSTLTKPPLPQRTVVLASDGTKLATLFYQDRIEVPISEISEVMQDAIVAIEDSRFYSHHGFDLRGTLRALVSNATSGNVQGGSTITQQYVKNILLGSAKSDQAIAAATERSYARKLQELRYALAIEKQMTKKQILEGYLNIAYFGSGAYGVEAAARRYFSKSASRLTLAESSLLAGLVQQPYGYDPIRHPEAALTRRGIVLNRMAELGYITQEQADVTKKRPLSDILNPTTNSNGCTSSIAPFFCDYVLKVVRSSPAFGATLAERDALLRKGGLTITTTLDVNAQAGAQKAVNKYIPPKDKSNKAAAISMIRPGTGDVVAMAQNRLWGTTGRGKTTYNYNTDRGMGGTIGMQAGSTFKIFVLAAAIEMGFSAFEEIKAPKESTYENFYNCAGTDLFPPYTAKNFRGGGFYNMFTGTAYSVNNYYVALEEKTGICRPAEIAESMGVRTGSGASLARVPSFVLGANEVTPLSVATAYAAFAAHGLYCKPRVILSVVDRDGKVLPIGTSQCTQVIDPEVADGVTKILRGVISGYPGSTGAGLAIGRDAAGKTGTTNDSAAVWFSGYTPDLEATVWVGDPRGGYRFPMQNIEINGRFYEDVFGSTLPGPIWRQSMTNALKDVPRHRFKLKLPANVVGDEIVEPTATPTETETETETP
ncbi:MAG: transglycosylase domain-containing protein [Actinobacteria bacterium]|nr:transglycosylase domain-containing protein [Actinomycetota bacterium]